MIIDTTRIAFAEAKQRSNFHETINLKEHPLLRITESYHEKDKVLCGLSSCKTPHNKGYIVETVGGMQTNIGHICGRLHLGADFRVLENRFRTRQRDLDNFTIIEEFLQRAPEYVALIDGLWNGERGAWWLSRCHIALTTLPSRIQTRLRDLIRTGDGRIFKYEESMDEDDDVAFLARLGYRSDRGVRKQIGQFVGLEGAKATSLGMFKAELFSRVHKYANASPAEMKSAERRAWVAFCGSIDEQIQRLKQLIEDGQKFFSEQNFKQLMKLANDEDERRGVRKIWDKIASSELQPWHAKKVS